MRTSRKYDPLPGVTVQEYYTNGVFSGAAIWVMGEARRVVKGRTGLRKLMEKTEERIKEAEAGDGWMMWRGERMHIDEHPFTKNSEWVGVYR